MNRQAALLSVVALLLIGAAAGSLRWMKSRIRMGEPGVRVVRLPLFTEDGRIAASNSVHLPSRVGAFRGDVDPIPELELTFLPPDTTFGRRTYRADDGLAPVSASVVLMGADRTSIHRPEYCMTGVGWQILAQSVRTVPMATAGAAGLAVQRFDMTREFELPDGRKIRRNGVYVFWFVADGFRTPSHSERQWRGIREVLTSGRNPRWAYVSFFCLCEPGGEDAAFERISGVVSKAVPEIEPESMGVRVAGVVDPAR